MMKLVQAIVSDVNAASMSSDLDLAGFVFQGGDRLQVTCWARVTRRPVAAALC